MGEMAAAVSNAGGFGQIGASGLPGPELRAEIAKAAALTDRPFGINVPVYRENAFEAIEIAIESGIKTITTSAGNPAKIMNLARSGNLTVIHKASSVKLAKKAEDAGVDAVIAMGFEAGGHVVFSGPPEALLKDENSLTGRYFSGREAISTPERRRPTGKQALRLTGAVHPGLAAETETKQRKQETEKPKLLRVGHGRPLLSLLCNPLPGGYNDRFIERRLFGARARSFAPMTCSQEGMSLRIAYPACAAQQGGAGSLRQAGLAPGEDGPARRLLDSLLGHLGFADGVVQLHGLGGLALAP